MNLVAVDTFFRHLLWTGDRAWAEKMWPVIERHLAWERRLFRRPFGPDGLPLYEAYACIWASDELIYHGGGATHATAYNYWHNLMAARVARWLGKDASPYEREAELILQAMRRELWLPDRGWFAEFKDYLGLQAVHPNAGLWTYYHTLDSQVPTPLEAWQMSRFVDTQIPRIPLTGAGVPPGTCQMPTTSWMPYRWSINNVALAESAGRGCAAAAQRRLAGQPVPRHLSRQCGDDHAAGRVLGRALSRLRRCRGYHRAGAGRGVVWPRAGSIGGRIADPARLSGGLEPGASAPSGGVVRV
jgi:hypothetical protein